MQHIRLYLFTTLLGVTGVLISAKASVVTFVDVVRVIDGDTVEIKTDGSLQRVRLLGIDAPEIDQEWGETAQQQLGQLIEGRRAILRDSDSNDRYGRTLGSLAVDDTDAGLYLLENGLAWHFASYWQSGLPSDWNNAYKQAQSQAEYDRLGLWSTLSPVPPSTWRKHKYEVQRDKWLTYHESLEATSAELQETFSKLKRRLIDRELTPKAVNHNKKVHPLSENNFIEEKESPTWWQLFVKLGEGISRWIAALFRTFS